MRKNAGEGDGEEYPNSLLTPTSCQARPLTKSNRKSEGKEARNVDKATRGAARCWRGWHTERGPGRYVSL